MRARSMRDLRGGVATAQPDVPSVPTPRCARTPFLLLRSWAVYTQGALLDHKKQTFAAISPFTAESMFRRTSKILLSCRPRLHRLTRQRVFVWRALLSISGRAIVSFATGRGFESHREPSLFARLPHSGDECYIYQRPSPSRRKNMRVFGWRALL